MRRGEVIAAEAWGKQSSLTALHGGVAAQAWAAPDEMGRHGRECEAHLHQRNCLDRENIKQMHCFQNMGKITGQAWGKIVNYLIHSCGKIVQN